MDWGSNTLFQREANAIPWVAKYRSTVNKHIRLSGVEVDTLSATCSRLVVQPACGEARRDGVALQTCYCRLAGLRVGERIAMQTPAAPAPSRPVAVLFYLHRM